MIITGLVETVLDYDEFVRKLDRTRPVHHNGWARLAPSRIKLNSAFRIYGLALAGHLLVFESTFETGGTEGEQGANE